MPGLLMLLLTLGLPPASLFGLLWMARFEEGIGKDPGARRPRRATAPKPAATKPSRAVSHQYRVPATPGAL
ncbi:hypothetical protein GCM10022242_23950 [Nocardioides panacisoli]|uniref:Secreted protein n=1 Tax=Nocardioides panacisoli TaxID=627624 RepID=A0ABP7ILI9_9ACTN